MTDTPPPKRRFWQIHMSTAVVMMIVIAVLLGLNCADQKLHQYGWPYPFFAEAEQLPGTSVIIWLGRWEWFMGHLVVDALVWILFVMLAVLLFEYSARSRPKP